MKKFLVIFLFLAGLMVVGANVQASSWIITPSGPLDTNVGDIVSFDLQLAWDGDDFYSTSMSANFEFDTGELAYHKDLVQSGPRQTLMPRVDINLTATHGFWSPMAMDNLTIDGNVFNMTITAPMNDTWGTGLIAGNTYDIANFYFDVIDDNPWDGLADFMVLEQNQVGETMASGIFPSPAYVEYDMDVPLPVFLMGAQGADVGSPATPAVPIPGAIWLLGSGLFGLVAIRRRRRVKA